MRYYWEHPMHVLQIRGFGHREAYAYHATDILLASNRGTAPVELQPFPAQAFIEVLKQERYSYAFVDGSPETVGYGVGPIPQSDFLKHMPNKTFMLVWVSAELRRAYRAQSENVRVSNQFFALGIGREELDVPATIVELKPADGLPAGVQEDVTRYLNHLDILALERLHRRSDLNLRHLLDQNSQLVLLLIENHRGEPILLANPHAPDPDDHIGLEPGQDTMSRIQFFISHRKAIFYMGGQP